MTALAKFRELGLAPHILDALEKKGFIEPSPIQSAAIPLLLSGEKDVVGQAQTGTGKTAAFGIPIIQILEPGQGYVQAIILSPTRELAIQITDELYSLKGTSPLSVLTVYGGQSIDIQLRRLSQGVDVVVGTPGRVIDLIKRGALKLSRVKFAVLDEADEMLNMGFVEDIEIILGNTPKDKRTLMFSATMPKPILAIAEKSMREYVLINVRKEQPTLDLTDQIYYDVRFEDKLEALSRIIDMEPDMFAMVFCRTKNDVDELSEKLSLRGYLVESLHGDIAQAQRTKVIERFKSRKFPILIATDVAARGIDVNDLTHVINYSIPQGSDTYIHRIGRTGRAGKRGIAVTFVTPSEYRKLTWIKHDVKTEIRKETLPRPEDLVARKKEKIVEKLRAVVQDGNHAVYKDFATRLLSEIGVEEAIAALLRVAYKNELNPECYPEVGPKKRGLSNPGSTAEGAGKTVRLFMAVGKDQGYGAKTILDLIWEKAHVRKCRIGKIDCLNSFSFINVPGGDAETIIEAFRSEGKNNQPFVEVASEKGGGSDGGGFDGDFKKKKKKKPFSEIPAFLEDYTPAAAAKKKHAAPPAWVDRSADRPVRKSKYKK